VAQVLWGLTLVGVTAIILTSGCATTGLYETGRTARPGAFQFGGALPLVRLSPSSQGVRTQFVPSPWAFARIGLMHRFDVGLSWMIGPGFGLGAKYQFLDRPQDAALCAHGSFYGLSGEAGGFAGWYRAGSRVVLSSEEKDAFPYALNAGVDLIRVVSGEDNVPSGAVLALGVGFGLPWRLEHRRSFRFLPEVEFRVPIIRTGHLGTAEGYFSRLEGTTLTAGFALSYVGRE